MARPNIVQRCAERLQREWQNELLDPQGKDEVAFRAAAAEENQRGLVVEMPTGTNNRINRAYTLTPAELRDALDRALSLTAE
jgi:hypothetical protein